MKTNRNLNRLIALTGALIISALPAGKADDKTKTDAKQGPIDVRADCR